MHHSDAVSVRVSKGKGRGVFARRAIAEGELIEQAPVVVLPLKEFVGEWENEAMKGHFFDWAEGKVAAALGYGSLYNHSYDPNATFDFDERGRSVVFRARRDIPEGEEITINYHHDVNDTSPMWFPMASEPTPAPAAPAPKATGTRSPKKKRPQNAKRK